MWSCKWTVGGDDTDDVQVLRPLLKEACLVARVDNNRPAPSFVSVTPVRYALTTTESMRIHRLAPFKVR